MSHAWVTRSLSHCRVLFIRSDSLFNSLYRSIQSRAGRRSRFRGLETQPGRDVHDVFRVLQSQLSRGTRYSSGPNNSIDPGGDRGQPTHFYPRRHLFVFKVVVPKDWGFERRVIWTLNLRGKANTGKGWLKADWEINDEVMMENAGAGSDPANEPPVITLTGSERFSRAGDMTSTATAQDVVPSKRRHERSWDDVKGRAHGLA